ncbi:MAG: alpha/beta hydrolase [Myxococcota bacterium]|nr:alpha/beta hydrolase [Myxococcota bacterium]
MLEWGGDSDSEETVLFLHGFLDCGASFTPLVEALPEGLHCVAPDLRGHGGTEWIGRGGYYHFADYLRDVRDLVDRYRRGRLVLVGHSMGGGVSALFAGSWPEEVHRLVLLEGLGPPSEDPADGPRRIRRWIGEVRSSTDRSPRRFENLDEVADRLGRLWPTLPAQRCRELAGWLTQGAPEGGLTWSYDPLHRTRTPQIYQPALWAPFLEAISCPVLTVSGGKSRYRWPDLDARMARLSDHRHEEVDGASHMLHLDAPEQLARSISAFMSERRDKGS